MAKGTPVLKEVKSLEQLRDELRVQTHLFKAEVKNEWKKIEQDWKILKRELRPTKEAAHKSKSEIKRSTQQLLKSLKAGYRRVKQAIPTPRSPHH